MITPEQIARTLFDTRKCVGYDLMSEMESATIMASAVFPLIYEEITRLQKRLRLLEEILTETPDEPMHSKDISTATEILKDFDKSHGN